MDYDWIKWKVRPPTRLSQSGHGGLGGGIIYSNMPKTCFTFICMDSSKNFLWENPLTTKLEDCSIKWSKCNGYSF